MAGLFFQMPLRQLAFFSTASVLALINNIETNSTDPGVLRYRTYPKFITFNVIMIVVAI
jgi:hypothetical protein